MEVLNKEEEKVRKLKFEFDQYSTKLEKAFKEQEMKYSTQKTE